MVDKHDRKVVVESVLVELAKLTVVVAVDPLGLPGDTSNLLESVDDNHSDRFTGFNQSV